MSQESEACCTTSMYDIQNRCIPDEIDLFYFKTCIITHNNNVIEQNINVSMFDILSVKEPHTLVSLLFTYSGHSKRHEFEMKGSVNKHYFEIEGEGKGKLYE